LCVTLKGHGILTDSKAFSDCEMDGKTIPARTPSPGLERKLSMNAIVSRRTGKRSDTEVISIFVLVVDDGLGGWQAVLVP
jgi:hypothetical protein